MSRVNRSLEGHYQPDHEPMARDIPARKRKRRSKTQPHPAGITAKALKQYESVRLGNYPPVDWYTNVPVKF